jgi:hypothetical protein
VTWAVPETWPFALLALAAWRTFKLLSEDAILDRPRDRLAPPDSRRDHFLSCAYCLGAHCALAWWLAWIVSAHWATVVAVPFALSAVVALIAVHGDSD